MGAPHQPRLYGRQVAHGGLRPAQRAALDASFPAISIEEEGPPLSLEALGCADRPLWLEIGFGSGEHLVWQAQQNPDCLLLGVEPFLTGVAKCVTAAEGLENVRLCAGDARLLLQRLPDACAARVFILHPDPWPKWRHAKRRLIQPVFLNDLARIVMPGGDVRLGTDWPDYSAWALRHFLAHPDFEWQAQSAADWQDRPEDWPITRYATKAAAQGRVDVHLRFLRAS